MKLFHNIHDKFSRDYIDLYGDGLVIVDWYEDNQAGAIAWLTDIANPQVSRFPAVLVETNDEMNKAQANSPWSSSFFGGETLPLFIYPEAIDWNLNQLK